MGLSPQELELQTTEFLPAREVMQGLTDPLGPVTELLSGLGLGDVGDVAGNTSTIDGVTGETSELGATDMLTGGLGSSGATDALGGAGGTDVGSALPTEAVTGLVAS